MSKALILLLLLSQPKAQASWWANLCEKYLVAEDMTQFEHLSVDQLIYVYWLNHSQQFHSKALITEIRQRIKSETNENRELLTKIIANEE